MFLDDVRNESGNGTIWNLIDTNGMERAPKIQFTMLVNGPVSNDGFDECLCIEQAFSAFHLSIQRKNCKIESFCEFVKFIAFTLSC